MKHVMGLYRSVRPLVFLVFAWCSLVAPVLAAKPAKETAPAGEVGPSAWVLPYALVLFSVGLGLMMVLRSARRSDRHKPEQYAANLD